MPYYMLDVLLQEEAVLAINLRRIGQVNISPDGET